MIDLSIITYSGLAQKMDFIAYWTNGKIA